MHLSRVADPHHLNADPASFHLMGIRIRIFALMWIRIRLLINVMRICNYWSTLHPRFHLKLEFFIVSVHGLSCLH
jgi:hypothetical protein